MKGTLLFCLAVILACLGSPMPTHAARGPVVEAYVSILPQAYFLKMVGNDRVDAQVLVGPGQSHETYEPTPRQLSGMARADVYFSMGVPFEKALVPKVRGMFPGLRIVDVSRGVAFLSFAPGAGEHGIDPHIWLDPKRVKIIARDMCEGLSAVDTAHAKEYEKNLARFQADLDALDARIARILAPVKGRTIYVFHPAFQYFCQSYGLRQEAFESEGKEPSARQMAKLITAAKRDNVKVVFVQPQFSQKTARAIAQAIGGRVVTLDPLPSDYPRDMAVMATTIRDSLQGVNQ